MTAEELDEKLRRLEAKLFILAEFEDIERFLVKVDGREIVVTHQEINTWRKEFYNYSPDLRRAFLLACNLTWKRVEDIR